MSNNAGYRVNPHSGRFILTKGWIMFAQVFGSLLAVIGLVYSLTLLSKMDYSKIIPEYKLGIPILFAIVTYSLWRTIATAFVIVRFLKKSSDDEFISNRYILASLSLNVGGFLTPWLLTSLPNIQTESTIKPKWFLSRVFSVITSVGSIIFLSTLIWQLHKATNGDILSAFNQSNPFYVPTIVSISISVLFILIGLPTIILYYNKNSQEQFEGDTSTSKAMRVFAYFYLILTTIELAFVMLASLLRLLGGLADLFKELSSDSDPLKFFRVLFTLVRIILQIIYVLFLMRIIAETIRGIWQRDGIVKIRVYDRLKEREQVLANRR
ncbi:hypothetical protein [Mycoplasma yeatsii]|uniref:hypothetical protein n=1 Tax=Mycoplasma yeatsii TaxID=51365 RepID=UPI0005B23DEE|nr:hypothetical protein [Mycoplasma yeatsii]AJM72029.1 membrane protein [Mycoplasma yeatsii GM274B]